MRKMNGKQIIAVDYPIAYYRTATKDGKMIQYKTNRMKVHFSKKVVMQFRTRSRKDKSYE